MTLPALLVANLVALAIAVLWLATLVLPYDRAVRVRNAFLLRRGARADLAWTPRNVPPGFRVERMPAPTPIAAAVDASGIREIAGDWPRALALVTLLVQHAREEGHARADLVTTFGAITAGRGSCADYVRVYLAAAHHAGLFCRQWGFSFDGFGGHGHTFVEVYDSERGRWAFLDVHNNVYAASSESTDPLDALAVCDRVRAGGEGLAFNRAGPGRLGWPDAAKLAAYYRRGANEWYVLWGNDVISRDGGRGRWAHRLRSAVGSLPPFLAIVTQDSEAAFDRMLRLRDRVRRSALVVVVLAVAFGAQLVRFHRHA